MLFGGGGWSLRRSSFTCYYPPRPDRPRDLAREKRTAEEVLSHTSPGVQHSHTYLHDILCPQIIPETPSRIQPTVSSIEYT